MGKNTRKQPHPSTPTRQSSRLAEKTPADRSSDESDASNSGKGPNVAKSSQHPSKKARTVNPDDMDIAFAETTPKPLNPTAPAFTAVSPPKNDNTVDPVNSTAAPRDPANNGLLKPDNLTSTPIQDTTTFYGNNAAGSSTTPSPNDHHNKSQHDSANKNSGDDHPTPTPMNTNENPVTSDDVTKYLASSPLNDIIKDKETRNNALNRVKFYLTSNFPTSFKSARFAGSGDETIIIVSFKDEEEFKLLLSMEHTELKQTDSSESLPQFHVYDAIKIRTEETLRSIVITDIPLFLRHNDVKSRFAQHGTIQKFSMTTPPNSMYQKALITYTDPDVVKRWETTWISWCKCQCLRVAPAYHTNIQHDSHFQYAT